MDVGLQGGGWAISHDGVPSIPGDILREFVNHRDCDVNCELTPDQEKRADEAIDAACAEFCRRYGRPRYKDISSPEVAVNMTSLFGNSGERIKRQKSSKY
jgi:hypothetical protein